MMRLGEGQGWGGGAVLHLAVVTDRTARRRVLPAAGG